MADTVIESVQYYVQYYVVNFVRNLTNIFNDMDAVRWIRLVAIVGGYLFLRPYLTKLGEHLQTKQHAKVYQQAAESQAKISPNALRGLVGVGEEGGPAGKGTGQKTGSRKGGDTQPQQSEEPEVDYKEVLVDYVEGEDGW